MSRFIDLTGKRYGRLRVIKYVGDEKWECECDCGKITYPASYNLNKGHTKSCGCKNKEDLLKALTKHGKRHTKIYSAWCRMKRRCSDKNIESFKYYGGRGISVCEKWKNSFSEFYDWAMANGYDDNLEIDRIDNDGNYSPENCKFSTRKEQVRNRSNTLYIIYNGKSITFIELCEKFNINYKIAHGKYRKGKSLEEIFKLGEIS